MMIESKSVTINSRKFIEVREYNDSGKLMSCMLLNDEPDPYALSIAQAKADAAQAKADLVNKMKTATTAEQKLQLLLDHITQKL